MYFKSDKRIEALKQKLEIPPLRFVKGVDMDIIPYKSK